MHVIIGAGPAGLVAAIKLLRAGVDDVVVYDPYAGSYTRPGHIAQSVFAKAESSIGIDFWSPGFGHIKDLERCLYDIAKRLGVRFENKAFADFHPDKKNPGITVIDSENRSEFVPANYVFDCTGKKRVVVNRINELDANTPFSLSSGAELPVKTHFLAYIKMQPDAFHNLNFAEHKYRRTTVHHMQSLFNARTIAKLRAMGWREFRFPRCYGVDFGKNKYCMYFQAPDELSEADYDKWIQAVFECYVGPIPYEKVTKLRKYSYKPRFGKFTVSANYLNEMVYKGTDLPTVIPLGDAQIDADYSLAHGIENGIERIDELMEFITVRNKQIEDIDLVKYRSVMKSMLKKHREELVAEADELNHTFLSELASAMPKFEQALYETSDSKEQEEFFEILKEIIHRLDSVDVIKKFYAFHDAKNKLILTPEFRSQPEKLAAELKSLQESLLLLLLECQDKFAIERSQIGLQLSYLVRSWQTVIQLLIPTKIKVAMESYEHAVKIFQYINDAEKECNFLNDYIDACFAAGEFAKAISICQVALEKFKTGDRQARFVVKLVNALCVQAENELLLGNEEEANYLASQSREAIIRYKIKLDSPSGSEILERQKALQRFWDKHLTNMSDTKILKTIGTFKRQDNTFERSKKKNTPFPKDNIEAIRIG